MYVMFCLSVGLDVIATACGTWTRSRPGRSGDDPADACLPKMERQIHYIKRYPGLYQKHIAGTYTKPHID